MSKTFLVSQLNHFDSMRLVQNVRDSVCKNNSGFKPSNINTKRGFYQELGEVDVSGTIYKNRLYKPLEDNSNTDPFISLDLGNAKREGDFKDNEINSMLDSTLGGSYDEVIFHPEKDRVLDPDGECMDNTPNEQKAKYYKVYQDSHTIVSVDLQFIEGGLQDGKFTGYIFASRCVPNDSDFLIEQEQPERSALWILEKLTWRPYYFPRDATGKGLAIKEGEGDSEIKCCEADHSSCESIYDNNTNDKGWIPRIYTVFIKNKYDSPGDSNRPGCEEADPTDGSFIAKVVSIQENPSEGEANLIWGSGFLLTFLKPKINESSAPFYLDIMFLKNTCEGMAAYKPYCQYLSIGTNPKSQEIQETGSVFRHMSEFLQLNVSKCSNYATGMDSTSIIEL